MFYDKLFLYEGSTLCWYNAQMHRLVADVAEDGDERGMRWDSDALKQNVNLLEKS